MPEIDYLEFLRRLGFLLEGICLVFVSKFIRDLFYMARGYKLRDLIGGATGTAAALDLSGFLIAVMFATVNSIIVNNNSWVGQASDIAITGIMITCLLLIADWITDKAIFRKMDDCEEIYNRKNTALAFGRVGNMIATGLIISSSLGDAGTRISVLESLSHCLIWFAYGQVALIGISLLYQLITPYDDLEEIKKNNLAAAIPIACIQLAVGLTISSGVHGVHDDTYQDIFSVSLYLCSATVLLYLLRTLCDVLLLPRTKISEEIKNQKNIGAGLIEGTAFLLGGIILSYFLT